MDHGITLEIVWFDCFSRLISGFMPKSDMTTAVSKISVGAAESDTLWYAFSFFFGLPNSSTPLSKVRRILAFLKLLFAIMFHLLSPAI